VETPKLIIMLKSKHYF